jgi:hypothetical protein
LFGADVNRGEKAQEGSFNSGSPVSFFTFGKAADGAD